MSEDVKKTAAKPLKQYMVTFHSNEGDEGDVVLGHNYRLNQYQRNVPVRVDENFLTSLKDAVIHTEVRNEGKVQQVTIPRFNYSVEPV